MYTYSVEYYIMLKVNEPFLHLILVSVKYIFTMILIMKNSMKKEENKILVNVRKCKNGSY